MSLIKFSNIQHPDTYGDIPDKDTVQGTDGRLLPKYDSQKDVCVGLVADLKTASIPKPSIQRLIFYLCVICYGKKNC